MYVVRTHN